jgi:hemerythrin-like domain-containing protein
MDAIALLREEHVAILAMLDDLERVPAQVRSVTPEDLPARKRLVTELVMAASAHEAIEEAYFWPTVQHWLEEGRALAAPALRQERSAKQVLAELDKLQAGGVRFEQLVSRLISDTREHIAYEESQVWPVVRQSMAGTELERLGKKMARARKSAPTRPHPHTPANPGVLKTVGVAAAVADRARDALTGRQRVAAWHPRRRAARQVEGNAHGGRHGVGSRSRWSDAVAAVLAAVFVMAAFRRRRTTRRHAKRGGLGPGDTR